MDYITQFVFLLSISISLTLFMVISALIEEKGKNTKWVYGFGISGILFSFALLTQTIAYMTADYYPELFILGEVIGMFSFFLSLIVIVFLIKIMTGFNWN